MPATTTLGIGNLKFYSKNGNPLNLALVDGIWTGTIYLPEVSTGLVENETIYIIQKMKLSGNVVYGTPHAPGTAHRWSAVMDPLQSDKINMFTVDNTNETTPFISFVPPTGLLLDAISNSGDTLDIGSGLMVVTDNRTQALVINVCLSSDDEDAYKNTITISDDNGIIAKISIYGETVGEDERFNVLLSNFGEQLLVSDEFIFRSSDVDEHMPDYKLLNRKRKELFIEYDNIIPYLASYKGIINILKFFDYYDIQLKEYWFNPNNNKRTTRDIQINDRSMLSKPPEIPAYPYQKTCNFGLFYEINKPTGEYDANGFPVMEWSDSYSQDEILIKLFGLRNYIYRRNIGGISRISDIVGQVIYYSGSRLHAWKDHVGMLVVNRNICPTFTVDTNNGYIQDIRSIINQYSCDIPREITELTGNHPVWSFSGCWVSFFGAADDSSPDFVADGSEDTPVGIPVTLTNTSFDVSWAECSTHWADTDNITVPVSWATIGAQNYYDIEWLVQYKPDVTTDTRSFTVNVRGSIADMNVKQFILPYSGKYSVTLILYGYNGVFSKHTEIDYIDVKLKQPDFVTFYKVYDDRIQQFDSCNLTWAEVTDNWNQAIHDTTAFPAASNPLQDRSLSPVPYIPLVDNYSNDRMIGYRELRWKDITENTWNDAQFVQWKEMTPIYGKPARFKIQQFLPGGNIQVGRSFITVPLGTNIADYVSVANILNSSTDEDINTFTYVARPFDMPTYVDCVSLKDGVSGNMFIGSDDTALSMDAEVIYATWAEMDMWWEDLPIYWTAATYVYKAVGIDEPFTKNNVRYFVGHFDVPVFVSVAFTYDNSAMPGKTNTRWVISLTDTGVVVADVTAPRLMYRFTKIGNYDIKCTITDTEGNNATVSRTSCIAVLNPDEWKRLHPY